MPLGISKTTKAYLLAWNYTFSYSPLALWYPALSHFKRKRVFFLTFPWFQHLLKITYNFPNTVKRALHQGSRQFLPCRNRLVQPPLRSEALLGRLWFGRRIRMGIQSHEIMHPSLQGANRKNPTQDTVKSRSLSLCGSCGLYLSCPYGEGVALKLFAPQWGLGSLDSGP